MKLTVAFIDTVYRKYLIAEDLQYKQDKSYLISFSASPIQPDLYILALHGSLANPLCDEHTYWEHL